jgi:2-hydroxy-4-carboxymuconate semialdehyde hemiacetal dehydrogenase
VHADADARRAGLACLKAGKHVQVEIPLCDVLADGRGRGGAAAEDRAGGHVRPHAPLQPQPPVGAHKIEAAGEFNIQQMDVQTYFFRRTNMNALGQPRSWTDHLLWHHAAHTVDLFAYQTGGRSCGQRAAGARSTRRWASRWTCRSS